MNAYVKIIVRTDFDKKDGTNLIYLRLTPRAKDILFNYKF